MINLEKTEIYEIAQMESFFWLTKLVQNISLVSFIIFIFLYIFNSINAKDTDQLLGISIVTLSVFVLMKNFNLFFTEFLKNPKNKTTLEKALSDKKINLAQFLNLKSAKYLDDAFKNSKKNGLRYPNYETILRSFLDVKNQRIIFIFSRLLIDLNGLKKELESNDYLTQITREE
jgi:hypothetical protein